MLASALLLAGCGAGGPSVIGGGDSGPRPVFIPAPGAAIGSGNGTAWGTVYAPVSERDSEAMALVNEFRTLGTLQGVPATAGTCLENKFSPRKPLSFNGVLHHAAYRANLYATETGMGGHTQTDTAHPLFWGASPWDRIAHSAQTLGVASPVINEAAGETLGGGRRTALEAVQGMLRSYAHCEILVDAQSGQIGISITGDPNHRFTGTSQDWMNLSPTEEAKEQFKIASITMLFTE